MQVINRATDGLPLLQIEAVGPKSKKNLTELYKQMQRAQFAAIPLGKADIHNTCGSSGDLKWINSISVCLLLGGIQVKELKRPKIKRGAK
jgi:hypothetical protein